jgi:pimeloyl-ACP methyl ester carboxylesterase
VSGLPGPSNVPLALIGHSQGAVVALLYASADPQPSIVPRLLVSVSGRYSSVGTENRLPVSLLSSIEATGRGVWLRYRAGKDWEKREYVVTKEALDAHRARVLDGVRRLPAINVLTLHGRADGTVWPSNAMQLDERISESEATNDVVLVAGVAHNWDREGEDEILAGHVDVWLAARLKRKLEKDDGVLVDHLASKPVRKDISKLA